MALHHTHLLAKPGVICDEFIGESKQLQSWNRISLPVIRGKIVVRGAVTNSSGSSGGGGGGGGGGDQSQNQKGGSSVPNSNYVVPLDKAASGITRPLAEILRDLNKRIPDNILKPFSKIVPWYHANRMLSFYAPGWCGDVRDVIFSDSGSVTVVYRVTIRGSDGEAYRESMGTVLCSDSNAVESIAAAEEIAFVKACARFGLGLYLYHEE